MGTKLPPFLRKATVFVTFTGYVSLVYPNIRKFWDSNMDGMNLVFACILGVILGMLGWCFVVLLKTDPGKPRAY